MKIRSNTKSTSILYAMTLSCIWYSCGLFESDVNTQTHKTQISVNLTGRFAEKEIATVSIDGNVIGNASKTDVAFKEVEPGMYKISAVDRFGKPAWSPQTVEVKENGLNYSLTCDAVTLYVHLSPNCHTPPRYTYPLELKAIRNEDQNSLAVDGQWFYEGDDGGPCYFDHGNIALLLVDAKNNLIWQLPLTYFQYGSSLSVSIPCQ